MVHLVPLTPAPLPEKIAKLLNDLDDIRKVVKEKVDPRWDVRPLVMFHSDFKADKTKEEHQLRDLNAI